MRDDALHSELHLHGPKQAAQNVGSFTEVALYNNGSVAVLLELLSFYIHVRRLWY
jgi:hypothetical protein